MYTSGTSGLPKGVLLTYGNLQSDVDAAIAHAGFESRHRFLGILPLFHAFGMMAMMLCPDPARGDDGLPGPVQPRGRAATRSRSTASRW